MKKVLLHICCGPCALYPVKVMREKSIEPLGFFYNPNIHPFKEFERRVEALEMVSNKTDLSLIWDSRGYGLKEWLDALKGESNHGARCLICYHMRLEQTARKAKKLGIKTISTTLLYSRYQLHEAIKDSGERCAKKYGLNFYYEDFRKGWMEGIEISKELEIYRQPYCGCIFSEYERYEKVSKRLNKRLFEASEIKGGELS